MQTITRFQAAINKKQAIDKGTELYRQRKIVNKFLADVRVLRNFRGDPKDSYKVSKEKGVQIARAISDIHFFISSSYIRDTNESFDLYRAVIDPWYFLEYMSKFTINDHVNNTFFKPRNIEIIFNKQTHEIEAVFNKKEHVNLHFFAIGNDPHVVLNNINESRKQLAREFSDAVQSAGLQTPPIDHLNNFIIYHLINNYVNEVDMAVAKWIVDNGIPSTVEDFKFIYGTPTILRAQLNGTLTDEMLAKNPNNFIAKNNTVSDVEREVDKQYAHNLLDLINSQEPVHEDEEEEDAIGDY